MTKVYSVQTSGGYPKGLKKTHSVAEVVLKSKSGVSALSVCTKIKIPNHVQHMRLSDRLFTAGGSDAQK